MPSHWAKAHGGRVVRPWVGEATPPQPYKRLGLFIEPLPHRQENLCLSTKSWGQVDIFSSSLGLKAPSSFRPS